MLHPSPSEPLLLGEPITLEDLEQVARRARSVALSPAAREHVRASRRVIDELTRAAPETDGASPSRVYGVNTGFGALSEVRIAAADVRQLQHNLLRSHACGVGPNLPEDAVRAMMVLRAQVLALGHSGVRVELVELLLELLNRQVTPRIPAQGSVGASGDLAPLAHLALVLVGEGEASVAGGTWVSGADALRQANLSPLRLEAKEGLALINGTQYMAGLGALSLLDSERLATIADIAGAMSVEAQKGSRHPFDQRLMAVRPHPGQAASAENLRKMLADSGIMDSHRDCGKVQDAYSLRCMPQVHGATRDALTWIRGVLTREINSVTDNPLVFGEGHPPTAELISGGNFHGQPLALALDLAAIAIAELANISERRVEQLVNPALSSGLTPFLAHVSGLESGMMIAQVTSASLVSENKILAHPASVDSIPSSAGREDHVSMGSISARKLTQIVNNVRHCLAIELLTAAAGLDQRAPLLPGAGVRAAHAAIRRRVPPLTCDRALYLDIAQVTEQIVTGEIIGQAEAIVGPLV